MSVQQPPLLQIQDLSTHLPSTRGVVKAVDGISMTVHRGQTVGLVGESGSGKSMTALSIMGLVPSRDAIMEGSIYYEGVDLRSLSPARMREVRGGRIGMVFQDPSSYLNPVLKIRVQVEEAIKFHQGSDGLDRKVEELLDLVGLPAVLGVTERYPHELSGGMKQRVLIAIALACRPSLLIADEPTTALDVTLQAQILELLADLQQRLSMSLLLITHDLGVVAETCDKVYVMYAGRIVEVAEVDDFIAAPSHPYSKGLLQAVRSVEEAHRKPYSIPGTVPDLSDPPAGCAFHPRCSLGDRDRCQDEVPRLRPLGNGSSVACHWAEEHRLGSVVDVAHADQNEPEVHDR